MDLQVSTDWSRGIHRKILEDNSSMIQRETKKKENVNDWSRNPLVNPSKEKIKTNTLPDTARGKL